MQGSFHFSSGCSNTSSMLGILYSEFLECVTVTRYINADIATKPGH